MNEHVYRANAPMLGTAGVFNPLSLRHSARNVALAVLVDAGPTGPGNEASLLSPQPSTLPGPLNLGLSVRSLQ